MWGSIHVLSNQVNKKSLYIFEDVTYETLMQGYIKNRVKLWELIQFEG